MGTDPEERVNPLVKRMLERASTPPTADELAAVKANPFGAQAGRHVHVQRRLRQSMEQSISEEQARLDGEPG